MAHNLKVPNGKIKAYGLVRDKHGRPKVDDPSTIPPEVLKTLSKEDLEHIYGTHTHNRDS